MARTLWTLVRETPIFLPISRRLIPFSRKRQIASSSTTFPILNLQVGRNNQKQEFRSTGLRIGISASWSGVQCTHCIIKDNPTTLLTGLAVFVRSHSSATFRGSSTFLGGELSLRGSEYARIELREGTLDGPVFITPKVNSASGQ